MAKRDNSVIKQTGIVGGVQVIRLATGLIRNKLLALFFGASGVGVWAICLSFAEMMQQAAFMGMDKAGVKKVSENVDNPKQQALAIKVIRWSFLINSLLIALALVVFSGYLDEKVFSTVGKGASLLIAAYLLFNCNSLCTNSLLNGLRDIKNYALSQLSGVLVGNILIFAILPFITNKYLPHCFVIQGASNLIFATYFYMKNKRRKYLHTLREVLTCFKSIFKVGVGFWLPALYMAIVEYMIRQYLLENLSVEMLGIYQACWTVSNMYVGIILSSMGVALFPKLCQIVNDRDKTNGLINQQIDFGLLVTLPVILIIFMFAPEILTLLYARDFASGESIIHWQMLGVVMRLLGFPFGYALMAKGKSKQYMLSQFVFSTLNYLLVIALVTMYGVDGLGVNYFIGYLIYLVLMIISCRLVLGFNFNQELLNTVALAGVSILTAFIVVALTDGITRYLLATLLTLVTAAIVNKRLIGNFSFDIVAIVMKKLGRLR